MLPGQSQAAPETGCEPPALPRRGFGGHGGLPPPPLHAPRLGSRLASPTTRGLRPPPGCGAEQRFDQRAQRQPPHRIHGLCPAPLVTETADTRLVIGLEGCGNTGLSYRFGHLHVDVHMVSPPLWHTPHRQVCRTEAPRTSSAVFHCRRSSITRHTA